MPGAEIQRLAALAREAPDVLQVTPIINAQALATSDGLASGVVVRGISRAELEALPIVADSVRPGGGFTGFEGVEAPTILIGNRLAALVGRHRRHGDFHSVASRRGDAVRADATAQVLPRGWRVRSGHGGVRRRPIYMPLEQAQILFCRGDGADELESASATPTARWPR
ncbi:MAG: hypothetical protein R3C16_00040 [Hyphomonadaceae bacterium]